MLLLRLCFGYSDLLLIDIDLKDSLANQIVLSPHSEMQFCLFFFVKLNNLNEKKIVFLNSVLVASFHSSSQKQPAKHKLLNVRSARVNSIFVENKKKPPQKNHLKQGNTFFS